jgi:hypothetical protein
LTHLKKITVLLSTHRHSTWVSLKGSGIYNWPIIKRYSNYWPLSAKSNINCFRFFASEQCKTGKPISGKFFPWFPVYSVSAMSMTAETKNCRFLILPEKFVSHWLLLHVKIASERPILIQIFSKCQALGRGAIDHVLF